jgi:recombinational DNA repair ATPase RecF
VIFLLAREIRGFLQVNAQQVNKKVFYLGLILTHLDLIAEKSSRYPILLLDEVVAHLDQLRRSSLFDQIIKTKGPSFYDWNRTLVYFHP